MNARVSSSPDFAARASSAMIGGAGRVPSATLWMLLAALVVEFVLFDRFGSHRITSLYPRWNDQIQYLGDAYTGYEFARIHGFVAGLWHTLSNPSAQGTLHDVAALILFQLTGPSRSAALALNMLALIVWQGAMYFAVARRTRSSGVAFAAAMLPLALSGPWQNIPGSAYDFRLDHLAMCAIGVASAVALLTRRFASRAWSVGFGIAVAMALLTRFLSGTYFVVIFIAFGIWTVVAADRIRRTANLLLAALVTACLAGPIFWLNREWVWNYYYVGHYVGPESAIRNQNFGLGRSLAFVWGGMAERHVGWFFALFAAATTIGIITTRIRRNAATTTDTTAESKRDALADTLVCGAAFLFAPAVMLTLHPQKSDVVLSALVPGLVLLVIALYVCAANTGSSLRTLSERVTRALALAAGIAALAFFAWRQTGPADDPGTVANLRQVNTVADYILVRGQQAKLDPIRVAVDHITDALDAQVLRVICYERHRVWRNFDMTLPTGIAEPDSGLVHERLEHSDFVFLTADDNATGGFPYDKKLAALRPELRAWCESHLYATKRFTLLGRPVVLYERGPSK